MTKKVKVFGRFKLLVGMHSEGGEVYRQGDIFDSVTDLEKHNSVGCVKFMKVDKAEDLKKVDPTEKTILDAKPKGEIVDMNRDQLMAYAAAEEIELPDNATRQEILDTIMDSIG